MNNISIRNRVVLMLGVTTLGSLTYPSTVAAQSQFPNATTVTNQSQIVTEPKVSNITQINNEIPIPGSAMANATVLKGGSEQSILQTANRENSQSTKSPQIAQADISIGRSTRGGSSYIGLAGNIGLDGGESALGDGNFAVISKVGLTRTLSVRPAAIFGDNTSILIPITYDFAFSGGDDPFSESLPIAPYVGVGAAINTGSGSEVGFLVSGGVDLPLNEKFTATAGINAGFFDQTDIGLLLGVGYNFR